MGDRALDFLSFAYASGALKFGEFVLNSGRTSPYFLNTGAFSNGADLATLSEFYAAALVAAHFNSDFMLYGPAYKGIPLAAATAMALNHKYNIRTPYAFDRKEAKDHGELGSIVGSPVAGNVVIVEDVITSGISVEKAVKTIVAQGANPVALMISLDRMEKAANSKFSAVAQVQHKFNMKVLALANFFDLQTFVDNVTELSQFRKPIQAYGATYVLDSPQREA